MKKLVCTSEGEGDPSGFWETATAQNISPTTHYKEKEQSQKEKSATRAQAALSSGR